jgi:chromosome segregation ATPase
MGSERYWHDAYQKQKEAIDNALNIRDMSLERMEDERRRRERAEYQVRGLEDEIERVTEELDMFYSQHNKLKAELDLVREQLREKIDGQL